MTAPTPPLQTAQLFSSFLQLEHAARAAETPEALRFAMVNDGRRLFQFRQAALALFTPSRKARVEAVAGVALLDRNAPFLLWLESVLTQLAAREGSKDVQPIDPQWLDARERADWAEWSAPHALWIPLPGRDGSALGVLWFTRDQPWSEAETLLLAQLADCYAHAWQALTSARGGSRRRSLPRRKYLIGGALTLLALLALPVPQSALAPAQVVASEPTLVAAPLDGVIAAFAVEPNQPVAAGQELLRFDDTTLRSQRDIARRTLDVAQAELHRASQGAFTDRESSAQLALLQSRVKLRQSELDYAEALLQRVVVRAERAGIAIFGDAQQWIGRPVRTGERILQLAEPQRAELRIELPVGAALTLQPGADIELFLDNSPLRSRDATLTLASYEAESTPDGTLAFRLQADFDDGEEIPRIGLRGTAKVYGERSSLFMYLFRRPLSALRQGLGL